MERETNERGEPRQREPQFPTRLLVIWDDRVLQLEEYANSGAEAYYKTRRPGGGTIEVHLLGESFFDDHPHAGEPPE